MEIIGMTFSYTLLGFMILLITGLLGYVVYLASKAGLANLFGKYPQFNVAHPKVLAVPVTILIFMIAYVVGRIVA